MCIPDCYPVLNLHEFSANLHGKSIFSKLDLPMACQEIPVDSEAEDIPKTIVITPFRLCESVAMTYSLCNVRETSQRYIYQASGELEFVFVYIEEILIASLELNEHKRHLCIVFQRLNIIALRIQMPDWSKCDRISWSYYY